MLSDGTCVPHCPAGHIIYDNDVCYPAELSPVAEFLKQLKLEKYIDVFHENDVTLPLLAELSLDELRDDLGIKSLGHRKAIRKAIQQWLDSQDNLFKEFMGGLKAPLGLTASDDSDENRGAKNERRKDETTPCPFKDGKSFKKLFRESDGYIGYLSARQDGCKCVDWDGKKCKEWNCPRGACRLMRKEIRNLAFVFHPERVAKAFPARCAAFNVAGLKGISAKEFAKVSGNFNKWCVQ